MKRLIKQRQFNVGIVESYKNNKSDKGHSVESSILGSFSVKGMTVENMISQNRTKYSKEAWAQPSAFGIGGKFLDENGKLKPTSLFGSVDHPSDDRAELLLSEAAIAWYDVSRNDDGSWDGSADILNNPKGNIVKTFLEYAKMRGGGDLLGVSSRALGETRLEESTDGQVESIIPETFELMTFDFVYNPSFQTATASINELSKANRKSLTESIRSLAKEDVDNKDYYESFADSLDSKETVDNERTDNMESILEGKTVEQAKTEYLNKLIDKENEYQNAIHKLRKMSDEDFEKKYKEKDKAGVLDIIKGELASIQEEMNLIENGPALAEEPKVEPKVEAKVEPKEEKTKKESNSKKKDSSKGQKMKLTIKEGQKLYKINLDEKNAIALIKTLKENNISYTVSDYKGLTHFTIVCEAAERTLLNSTLKSLNESNRLRIIKRHTLKEDVIEDFLDEEAGDKEEDKEEDSEEDNEEDSEEDVEEENEEDVEDIDMEETDEEMSLESALKEIASIKGMLEELKDFLMPVEDFEVDLDIDAETEEGSEDEDSEDEDSEDDLEDLELTEDELDELSDEELEFLLSEKE